MGIHASDKVGTLSRNAPFNPSIRAETETCLTAISGVKALFHEKMTAVGPKGEK